LRAGAEWRPQVRWDRICRRAGRDAGGGRWRQVMKRFQCVQCGYVARGSAPPAVCPVCGAPASDFEPLASALPAARRFPGVGWWLIHLVGISAVYALGVLARHV